MSRTFSDEVLQRLRELDAPRFEEKFRAAWTRLAPPQGVSGQLSDGPKARAIWRMCFSQALAECLDPKFYASMCRPKRTEGVKFVIPFGRTKGTPLNKAETKDLDSVRARLRGGLEAPGRERFRAENAALINAIEAELRTRQ